MNNLLKKRLHRYIKENQDKGYSIAQIKNALIIYGYDPNFTENLIRNYKIRDTIIKTSPIFLLLLLLMSFNLFNGLNITTFAVMTKQYNYTDYLGLTFNESAGYAWNLENKGILKAVRLNGEVSIIGSAKIYIENAG